MKKMIIGVLLVALLVLVAACKPSEQQQATKVAKAFFEALAKKDFKTAKLYVTKDSESVLDFLSGDAFSGLFDEEGEEGKVEEKEKEDDDEGFDTYKVLSVTVNGDKAIANVEASNSKKADQKETKNYDMVKEDGEWKVKMEKS
ncbi:MAG: hypothetical protein WCY21_07590 [Candidatus Cloacimonadaceae bacterium]|jgi:hypothetical protein|nr:DUF4878 domain-containing protein [Candidatus Cloacimonadota bacterium]MDX9950318.1 DUF4878 domain-containing protein [Candidatus Syntrophosphaera sp.]NLN85328.1 DUF4878 domain-containing protein [Candidatus Cloacimonadota bacterium]